MTGIASVIPPILIGGAIVAIGLYFAAKERNQKIAAGLIKDRKEGFENYAEIFRISNFSPEEVLQALLSADYAQKALVERIEGKAALSYKGAGWKAQLYHDSQEPAQNTYRFELLEWYTKIKGIDDGPYDRDLVLTAVEKAFEKLDPALYLATEQIDVKHRYRLF
ncbi:MAG: hypothetical protein IJU50_07305 [Lachnospiraceae bacterium]|nr:hypothetical protein [Lachnospiraceae bacterium]